MVPDVPGQPCALDGRQETRIGSGTDRCEWRCGFSGYGHAPMILRYTAPKALKAPDLRQRVELGAAPQSTAADQAATLPRISTNVSVNDLEPEADALTLFLNPLKNSAACSRHLVLPARQAVSGPAHLHGSCRTITAIAWSK
jgi:hypothetical protein